MSSIGANDIVCFHSLDTDQRQAHGFDHLVNGCNLFAKVVGHRAAVGLVLAVHFIAKGLSRRIEDYG